MQTDKVNICGFWIDNVKMSDAIQRLDAFIEARTPVYAVTPNVDHMVKLQRDDEFRKIYGEASLVLCDGAPLIWASKFLGNPIKERVCGSDLFIKLSEVASQKGYKLYFLGGRPPSALRSSEILRRMFPNIKIVGTYSPPFGFENDKEENEKIVRLISEAKPDILFVGLGAPKQEKWIYKYHKRVGVPVSIGIGVSFEFISGQVKRAPFWIRRCGFEWLWRLIMEPKRLWKRYLIDDLEFFLLILKQKINA